MTTNEAPTFTAGMRVADHWARTGTVLTANSDTFTLQWDDAHGTELYPQDTMMIREA